MELLGDTKPKVTVAIGVVIFALLALSNASFFYYSAYAQNSSSSNNNANKLVISDGIATGDVTNHSAIIWSRANTQAQMHVEYDTANLSLSSSSSSVNSKSQTVSVNQTTDFAGHIKIDFLKPDTVYYYRVWFSNPNNKNESAMVSNPIYGTFRTAPDTLTSKPVISFVVGGDLGGQSYCRRVGAGGLGYPIFSIMQALSPDFFVFNGDQIMEIMHVLQMVQPTLQDGITSKEISLVLLIIKLIGLTKHSYKMFTTNIGNIIELMHIYKIFCVTPLYILRLTTMKY